MDDYVQIIGALAQSYSDEVVFKERARQAGSKDMLVQSVEELRKKIDEKWKTYYEILKDSGKHNEATTATLRRINLDRLKRVDAALMQLEAEQLRLDSGDDQQDSKFQETRISQLRKRQAELESLLVQLTKPSPELDAIEAEIELLEQIANDLEIRIQMLWVNRHATPRIELIQPATVSTAE